MNDFLRFPAPRKFRGGSARSSVPSPTRSTVSPTVKFDRSVEGGQFVAGEDVPGEDHKELTTMSVVSLARFSE